MTIAQAAAATGLSAKTIRYYESIGLIAPPPRQPNRYRRYGVAEIRVLRFVSRARRLGFSLETVAELLRLWQAGCGAEPRVKTLAAEHLARLDGQIAALQARREALLDVMRRCESEPESTVLESFATDHLAHTPNSGPLRDEDPARSSADGSL